VQIRDFVSKYDGLALEDALFDIPLRKEYVLSRIGKGKRVLDVGCLGGKTARLIMEQNNEVWGVELNSAAAEVARQRGIRVKVADIEEGLPFEDSTFDVVNAGEVVERLYDTKNFFEESWRVLKVGGLLLFTTPNLNSLENRIRIASGGYLTMVGAYPEDHFGDHIRVFNLSKIKEICRQTGFQLVDVSGIPKLESWGKWVDQSLGIVGRLLPSFSKVLMVTAKKIEG
jgi:SAM-dependent methyltransferase